MVSSAFFDGSCDKGYESVKQSAGICEYGKVSEDSNMTFIFALSVEGCEVRLIDDPDYLFMISEFSFRRRLRDPKIPSLLCQRYLGVLANCKMHKDVWQIACLLGLMFVRGSV